MKKILLLLFLLPVLSKAQKFTLYITDNRANQNISYNYLIRSDSLIITGLSDGGKTKVDYLRRKLSKRESKSMTKFLNEFPVEKMEQSYFGDYTNLTHISGDNFPRVMEVRMLVGRRKGYTKITNAYVKMLIPLFNKVETMLPDEVKFRLTPESFGKTI